MENKRNYQRELDDILKRIEKNEKKPVLLLHSCCGPCSSYVLEYLTQYFYIKLFSIIQIFSRLRNITSVWKNRKKSLIE